MTSARPGRILSLRRAATCQTSALLTRLFVVGMLLQLSQQTALLQLHVEALQSAVDRLIRLDGNVNQTWYCLRNAPL